MSIAEAAKEAVAIAKGEQAAHRVYVFGEAYVPEADYARLTARVELLEGAIEDGVAVLDDLASSRVDDEVLASLIEELRAAVTEGEEA